MIFAYADETGFKIKENDIVGAGVLFSKKEITQEIINLALEKLDKIHKQKPQANINKTLERGHFHATDDSWIAREVFAKTIKDNIEGNIEVTFANNKKINSTNIFKSNMIPPHRQQQAIIFSLLSEASKFSETVNLFIEEGPKQIISQKSFWADAWATLQNQAIETPQFRQCFPKVEQFLVNKKNPGTQIIDLILWISQRNLSEKVTNNLELTSGLMSRMHSEIDNPLNIFFKNYYIGKEIRWKNFYPPKTVPNLNIDQLKESDFIKADNFAISVILSLQQQLPLPNHISHLENDIKIIAQKIITYTDYSEILNEVRWLFILLFDTLPIYTGLPQTDLNTWDNLLTAKQIIASMLRNNN